MSDKIKIEIVKKSNASVSRYMLVLYLLFFSPPVLKAQTLADYDSLIHKLMIDFKTPGIAVAVFKNNHWSEYIVGVSNIETRQPVTSNSLFNVASISKMLTAMAVMQLVEAGQIDLDAPVENYLARWEFPESNSPSSQVTSRRVLNHSAGLSQEFGPGFVKEDKLLPLVDILSGKTAKRQPLRIVYEPGTKHMYSNLGFGLLQLLIEEVTHLKFEVYMQEHLFNPLQMTSSSFKDPLSKELSDQLVTPYNHRLAPYGQERFVVTSATGLLTNLKDLELLLEAEINKNLISKTGYDDMHRSDSTGYGLGHMVTKLNNETLFIGHTGLGMGWNASFQFTPDSRDGIIVLTNGDNGYYIHYTLIGYWCYSITGKRIETSKVAPDKKLNWISLYLEISLEEDVIDKEEFNAFEKQLAGIRTHLKDDQLNAFVAQCTDMQTKLNNRIKDVDILENFNSAFASCLYWLNMPWFKD